MEHLSLALSSPFPVGPNSLSNQLRDMTELVPIRCNLEDQVNAENECLYPANRAQFPQTDTLRQSMRTPSTGARIRAEFG